MFIPPEGAVQFEVTHPKSTVKGEVFWVVPMATPRDQIVPRDEYQKHTGCSCVEGFRILVETCSRIMASTLSPLGVNIVCKCVGRIIE